MARWFQIGETRRINLDAITEIRKGDSGVFLIYIGGKSEYFAPDIAQRMWDAIKPEANWPEPPLSEGKIRVI